MPAFCRRCGSARVRAVWRHQPQRGGGDMIGSIHSLHPLRLRAVVIGGLLLWAVLVGAGRPAAGQQGAPPRRNRPPSLLVAFKRSSPVSARWGVINKYGLAVDRTAA